MLVFPGVLTDVHLPSRELTYPPDKAYLKMILLFPRWDMLDSWRVYFDPDPRRTLCIASLSAIDAAGRALPYFFCERLVISLFQKQKKTRQAARLLNYPP